MSPDDLRHDGLPPGEVLNNCRIACNESYDKLADVLAKFQTTVAASPVPPNRRREPPGYPPAWINLMTRAIPEGFQSVTPMLVLNDARKAIEFYKRALGAEELFVMPGPDGNGVMHAEMRIGDSIIMMGEEHPQEQCKSAEAIGGSPVSFYIYLDNVDEAFRVAVAAGSEVRMPVAEMFWGDRMGTVQDPFGYSWSLATHTRDLTPEEIRQGAQAFFARMKQE